MRQMVSSRFKNTILLIETDMFSPTLRARFMVSFGLQYRIVGNTIRFIPQPSSESTNPNMVRTS
jgi:hypothetical protein